MIRLFTGFIACGLIAGALSSANASIVLSNNGGTGDDFTNAATSNAGTPIVGSAGWVYNNVRNNGHVGINTSLPRSGNGSAWFQGTQGPSGNSSKADIEYYNLVAGNLASMGTLGNITSLAYEWYKSSTSTATQHAVLRLLVDADGDLGTINDRGALVYERAYQSNTSVPTDSWVSDVLMNANFWQVKFGTGNFDTAGNWQPLSVWGSASGFTPSGGGLNMNANSIVYGLSSGIGSGWGTYIGAVDNITIGFGTLPATTYNFEVRNDGVVPELSALVTWGVLALSSIISCQRRR